MNEVKVNRNDPCPCGSGKKYKKCCLKKEESLQLVQHQRDQYYQTQQVLVNQLHNFIFEKITYSESIQLQSQFTKRTNRTLSKDIEQSFFRNWLYYFYRFENGLRGIEWFYNENEKRLTDDERELAESWTLIPPRLLQLVDKTSDVFVFEDMLTNEQFPMSNDKENMPQFSPWLSTLSMIHKFQGQFFFQGLRPIIGPETMYEAIEKVKEYQLETKQSYEQILMEFFPEILTILLKEKSEDEAGTHLEYTLSYHVENETNVNEHLRNQDQLHIDKWNENEKKLSWYGNWRAYTDSELEKPVKVVDVYGTITLTNNQLQIHSMDKARVNEMKDMLLGIEQELEFIDEKEEEVTTVGLRVKNMVVSIEQDTPRYFALYAQQELDHEIDVPVPMFDHLSIRQLVKNDREDDALTWLKQAEYMMYHTILHQFGMVEITADFNTVRKELGLSLSPFVTGGDKRKSNYEDIEPEKTESQVLEDDIPFLEDLGFTPQSADTFYVTDMLHFYKEKAVGKSESTIRKYRNSLSDLREILEEKSAISWEQCNVDIWEEVMMDNYFTLNPDCTKTARRDFISTVKAFLKWLEQEYEETSFDDVLEFVDGIKN